MLFPDGIAAQPAVLTRSRETLTAALDRLAVPQAGQVIALVGIGASEYAARGAAPVWRAAGLRAFPLPAAEMLTTADLSADVSSDLICYFIIQKICSIQRDGRPKERNSLRLHTIPSLYFR